MSLTRVFHGDDGDVSVPDVSPAPTTATTISFAWLVMAVGPTDGVVLPLEPAVTNLSVAEPTPCVQPVTRAPPEMIGMFAAPGKQP
jgi:hypothetical protein